MAEEAAAGSADADADVDAAAVRRPGVAGAQGLLAGQSLLLCFGEGALHYVGRYIVSDAPQLLGGQYRI